MLNELRKQVCEANRSLEKHSLLKLTFGNVSGIDRKQGLIAIKPSGVPYVALNPEDIVILDMKGKMVEGKLRPSSDAPTHVVLYNSFPAIGGITHTHSTFATMFAQACRSIPCLGTTHADYFHGEVPLTRPLARTETKEDYELNMGQVIAERLVDLDPAKYPAVLVAHHGPFTWGKDAAQSVEMSILLEEVAKMAWGSIMLNPGIQPIPKHLLDRHFLRKHGPGAYYGQEQGR